MATKKRSLKGAFLTGLLALLPLLITAVILKIILGFIQSLVGPVMEGLLSLAVPPAVMADLIQYYVPTLLGIAVVGGMIFGAGLAIQLLFGKAFFAMLDSVLGHVPMVSGIYHGVRQITRAFDGSGDSGLRQVVLIRPIRGGTYMVGFLTRKVLLKGRETLAMVYVPTNTMYTGDTYLVPESEILPLDMPVEDGVKLVVSGGLVAPAELPLAKVPGRSGMAEALAAPSVEDIQDLKRRVQWIIQLRWLVTLVVPLLVLLLASQQVLLRLGSDQPAMKRFWPTAVLAAANLGLNGIYFLALRRGWKLSFIARFQVFLDMVIFSSIVYSTGGVASPFTFVYFNPILTACLFFSFRAGLLCAAISSLLYVSILYLQGLSILPVQAVFQPLSDLARNDPHYTLLMGVVWVYAFFLAALLTGFLARVLKKKEQELRQANATLDERLGELTLLFEVGNLVNSTSSLDRILRRTLDLLVERMGFDRALLYLVTDDRKSLKLKLLSRNSRYAGLPPESYTVTMAYNRKAGVTARAAVEKKLFNITDPQNHPLINKELARRIGLNPFAVAPMLVKNKVVGVIGVDHKYRGGPIREEEARSLLIFANQAGMTIENARLRARQRSRH